MLITDIPILLQRFVDDLFQLHRHSRIQPHRRHRRLVQDRVKDCGCCVAGERPCSGCHLVQHHTERKQIRAGIQVFSRRLLGRHVGNRPNRAAGTGEHRFGRHVSSGCRFRLRGVRRQLGQTEVQNLGLPTRRHENVCRLDVAMNDALGMRGVQRIGNLNRDLEQFLGLQPFRGDSLLEGSALSNSIAMKGRCSSSPMS